MSGRRRIPLPGWGVSLEVYWREGRIHRIAFVEGEAGGGGADDPLAAWVAAWQRDPTVAPPQVPLAPAGTAFQRRVWAALRAIPPGETRTYGALAAALGSHPRAVAGACRANPWVLLVPCHRAVSTCGPGGFMGATDGWPLALKRRLLAHEGGGGP